MAAIGEPWQTFFDPQELVIELKDIGFTQVEDVDPENINSQFFNDRTDKLKVGSFFGHPCLCLYIPSFQGCSWTFTNKFMTMLVTPQYPAKLTMSLSVKMLKLLINFRSNGLLGQ